MNDIYIFNTYHFYCVGMPIIYSAFPVQEPSTGKCQTWCQECDATENLLRYGKGMNCAGDWNMICEACDEKEMGGRNLFAKNHPGYKLMRDVSGDCGSCRETITAQSVGKGNTVCHINDETAWICLGCFHQSSMNLLPPPISLG